MDSMFNDMFSESEGDDRIIGSFDIETQRSASEVGWDNKDLMYISVAVVLVQPENKYYVYTEDEYVDKLSEMKGVELGNINALVEKLKQLDVVVGYNLIDFDYAVLSHYTDFDLHSLPTVDMMIDVNECSGRSRSLKLDNLTKATLGEGKTDDALNVFKYFDNGEMEKIAIYCKDDVKISWKLYDFGSKNGYVYFENQTGKKKPIENIVWNIRQNENFKD